MSAKKNLTPYAQKLLDPRWQRKRLEILNLDNFTCQDCRSKSETLHVHHSHYRKGVDPWDYEDEHLVTLCEDCHKAAENRRQIILQETARPFFQKKIAVCTGILNQNGPFSPWHNVILVGVVDFALSDTRIHCAKDQEELDDAMSLLRDDAAEICASVHRVLFAAQAVYEETYKILPSPEHQPEDIKF